MDLVEDNTSDPDEDCGLDTSWIQRETQIQNIQNNYSREPMEAIHGIFIYINPNTKQATIHRLNSEGKREGTLINLIKLKVV